MKSMPDFNNLYRDYYAALCYFSLRIIGDTNSAEDIVEDVFANLLNSKREFTATDNLKAWLYTSTKNSSLNYLKQQKHKQERQFEFVLNLETEEPAHVYEMIKVEVLRGILLEIKKLPGHSGRIIELSYLEGMKNEKIAELLGISEKTVKNLKSAGLATLRSKISPEAFTLFLLMLNTGLITNVYLVR